MTMSAFIDTFASDTNLDLVYEFTPVPLPAGFVLLGSAVIVLMRKKIQ